MTVTVSYTHTNNCCSKKETNYVIVLVENQISRGIYRREDMSRSLYIPMINHGEISKIYVNHQEIMRFQFFPVLDKACSSFNSYAIFKPKGIRMEIN